MEVNAEKLEAVHTHTHTHTYNLLNKKKISIIEYVTNILRITERMNI